MCLRPRLKRAGAAQRSRPAAGRVPDAQQPAAQVGHDQTRDGVTRHHPEARHVPQQVSEYL